MPIVTGTPNFPFYMPGSSPVEYPMEDIARQRALALQGRGYNAGVYVHPGDPYLGKAIEAADLYYEHPNVPGYHFQQQHVEGDSTPPRMLPGPLESRIALELAKQQAYGGYENYFDAPYREAMSPQMSAYQAIVAEADRRARFDRQPIRRPRG